MFQGIDTIYLQVLAPFLHDPHPTPLTCEFRSWRSSFASVREIKELRDGPDAGLQYRAFPSKIWSDFYFVVGHIVIPRKCPWKGGRRRRQGTTVAAGWQGTERDRRGLRVRDVWEGACNSSSRGPPPTHELPENRYTSLTQERRFRTSPLLLQLNFYRSRLTPFSYSTAYASFGGLLMSLTGSFRHMTNVVLGESVYVLLRR